MNNFAVTSSMRLDRRLNKFNLELLWTLNKEKINKRINKLRPYAAIMNTELTKKSNFGIHPDWFG